MLGRRPEPRPGSASTGARETMRGRRAPRPPAARAAEALFLTFAAAMASILCAAVARAQGVTSETSWTMTPLKETFTVQQWSNPCGPPPVSGTMEPAGPATVDVDYGELVIATGHKTFRSDQCIDPLPTLSPQTHSNDGRTWRTRCATPPADPRHAVINTAYFRNADDFISLAETGRYEFTVQGARCIADVAREASLTRVALETPAAESSAPRTAPSAGTSANAGANASANAAAGANVAASARANPCAAPGKPARLEVRPSRKLLRFGETYRFRAIVLDENGCPTTTPIQWSIGKVYSKEGDGAIFHPAVDEGGTLTVPISMAAEAKLDVVATAAGRSAQASVEVTSASSYEQLLAQSGLDRNGERGDPAIALLATSSLGAADARAQDGARHRRLLFMAIIFGLALLLATVGIFSALRMRKVRAAERAARARHAEKMLSYERQKKEREKRHAQRMRAHVESVARAGSATLEAPAAFGGHELIPQATVDAPAAAPPRGKICPTCGERFEGNAAFCGKDGTQLVLLN